MKKLVLLNFIFLIIFVYYKEHVTALKPIKDNDYIINYNNKINLNNTIVKNLNKKNSAIRSIVFSNCDIYIWRKNLRLKFNSNIFYNKETNFHMEIFSLFGKELDLGSNQEVFWYWSKREKPPALYWAYFEDFHKTRLKNPFDPLFIKSTLGIDEIKLEDAIFNENNKEIIISYKKIGSNGEELYFSIFICKKLNLINKFLLQNKNRKNLAICEIIREKNYLIKEIKYLWKEEEIKMSIIINSIKKNIDIDPKNFELPNLEPKINIANE